MPIENCPTSRQLNAFVIGDLDDTDLNHIADHISECADCASTLASLKKRLVLGGSTISQQTVKNLFLDASRNPLRKWHELVLTVGMERALSKRRIVEIYLNIAEFGRGIYGVDAAARFYWGISASELTERQSIELAATLPSPIGHNPATRTRSFQNRVRKMQRYL